MTNRTAPGNGTGAYSGGIPLNVTLHAWPIPKLDVKLKQFNETSPGVVKTSESAKNYTNSLLNLNATGYVAIEDDLTDTGFTDVQTFMLAGIATVIPLLIAVATILGIRFLWRRYRARSGEGYEGVLQKEESSEPLGKLQSYSLPQELKTSESQFTMTPGEDMTSASTPQLLTPKSNGSVITMTLKNNHLIVETEETDVSNSLATPTGMKIESKGTTTKFVTSTAPDFRLDVTSGSGTEQNKESSQPCSMARDASSDEVLSSTNHGALVHCPPEETEDETDRGSCNTGLSQSDLSMSSTESQNPSYRYGNQMGYDSGGYGYPEYSGYYSTFANAQAQPNVPGPKEHKVYMRSSSVIESETGGSYNPGPQLKDILMSDIQAREKRVEEDEERRYQEEQRILGNGDVSVKKETEDSLEESKMIDAQSMQLKSVDKLEHITSNDVGEGVAANSES